MKWAFFICLALLSVSCGNLLKSKPAGLLNKSQMTDILVDLHLTEATVKADDDSISRLNDTLDLRTRYAEVFRKHNVTPDEFNTSLNYYIEQIDELDKIYAEVLSRITEMEANLRHQEDIQNKTNAKDIQVPRLNPWFLTFPNNLFDKQLKYFDESIYPVNQLNRHQFPFPVIKKGARFIRTHNVKNAIYASKLNSYIENPEQLLNV